VERLRGAAGSGVQIGVSSLEDLIKAAKCGSLAERGEAIWEIGALGADACAALPVLIESLNDSDLAPAASATLTRLGAQAVTGLRTVVRDGSTLAQRYAIQSLAELGTQSKEAIAELAQCLQSKDSLVQSEAADAIIVIGAALGNLELVEVTPRMADVIQCINAQPELRPFSTEIFQFTTFDFDD
jgi:HEAT repeat protein